MTAGTSHKKHDRNNYRWCLVIIAVGGTIINDGLIMFGRGCFISMAGFKMAKAGYIITNAVWTIIQAVTAIIIADWIIGDVGSSIINAGGAIITA